LNKGDSLAVALTSNPSTGYEWTLETIDTTLLRPDGTSYSGSDVPGNAGTETFCFTALHPGTTTLSLHYHQPFAKGVPPLETFEVIVEIKD
jgi:predicted secreted protein